MRFSLTRGNVNHLLLSGIIYILAVFVIPLQLPRNISVDNRVTIVLFLSLTATFILGYIARKGTNDIDRQQSKYNFITLFAIGIIGFISMMLLQGILNGLLVYLSNFFNFPTKSKNTSNVVEVLKLKPYFILYVAVLGPIMEELFFRKAVFGYFYDAMIGSKKWIRFTIPALITGIIFALPHDGFSPIMIVYIGMSFVFSYLYLHTKRIITPIVAHILMNSLVVLVTGTFLPFWMVYLTSVKNLSVLEASSIFSMLYFARVISGIFLSPYLIKKYNLNITMKLSVASGLILAISYGFTNEKILLGIITFLFGLIYFMISPLVEGLASLFLREENIDYGKARTYGSLGYTVVGIFIGGVLGYVGNGALYYILIFLVALYLVFMFLPQPKLVKNLNLDNNSNNDKIVNSNYFLISTFSYSIQQL